MPRLVIERGNERGVSINLDAPEVTLTAGRLKSCDLVLTDTLVSRQHFRICKRNNVFTVIDLQSHNGTYLNGQRVEGEMTLPAEATIRAGETLLSFKPDSKINEGALAGKRLAGYSILHRIGVGGMGEVYKAIQLSLTREVALKVLSPDLVKDRTFVERFLSEARAAGKFNHPNVVNVHEVGNEEGCYYYSMEYLEGGSLQDQVSRARKLDPERATLMMLQAARALEYAEKIGIVHCDIKPDNLMLSSGGDVRLADLGIAKTLNEKGKAEQSDGVFGSPNYMSPEQARGLPLDHRSDLYSLGVTYYRILLGKVPFTGKDAKRIMEKVVFDEPEPPRKLDPNLPPMIYTILGKLLKKKPSERYQRAAELIVDLEEVLEQCKSSTRGTTTGPLPKVNSTSSRRRSGRTFGV
jgi:serine/threonine-protein kinase